MRTSSSAALSFSLLVVTNLFYADGSDSDSDSETVSFCTVCKDGSPVPNPDRVFEGNQLPARTCGGLDELAKLLRADQPLCDTAQAFSTMCGCAYDEENACSLCVDGTSVQNLSFVIPNISAAAYIPGASAQNSLSCETLQSVLHQSPKDSAQCGSAQHLYWQTCGCPQPNATNPITNATFVETPTNNDDQNENSPESVRICTLCIDGGDITEPNKVLDIGQDFPISNCRDLNNFAGLLRADSIACSGIQSFSTYCGCSYQRNQCTFCPNGEAVSLPDKKLTWFSDYVQNVPEEFRTFKDFLTCGIYEALLHNIRDDAFGLSAELQCLASRFKSGICGCDYGWESIVLLWCNRIAGLLSLIGSLCILWDITFCRSKFATTYHQFLIGMSMYDAISSTMHILASIMMPASSGVYGAVGSDITCKIQGFGIQWGLTSVFYNVLLSTYFLLVVRYNWKEKKLRVFRPIAHACVNFLGLGLAVGGLWFYDAQFTVCYILKPPVTATWLPVTIFYTIPISVSLVAITLNTTLLCHKVFSQELVVATRWHRPTTFKPRASANTNDSGASIFKLPSKSYKLSRKVFWQSLCYVLSFIVTLPFLMVSYHVKYRGEPTYWVFVAVSLLTPSQGLLNAIVYFQRSGRLRGEEFNLIGWLCCNCCCTQEQNLDEEDEEILDVLPTSYRSTRDNPDHSPPNRTNAPTSRFNTSEHLFEDVTESEGSCTAVEELWKIQNDRGLKRASSQRSLTRRPGRSKRQSAVGLRPKSEMMQRDGSSDDDAKVSIRRESF